MQVGDVMASTMSKGSSATDPHLLTIMQNMISLFQKLKILFVAMCELHALAEGHR